MLAYINNCKDEGAYKIKFDYINKSFEILDALMYDNIMEDTKNKLLAMYEDNIIYSLIPVPGKMAMTIDYSKTSLPHFIKNLFCKYTAINKQFLYSVEKGIPQSPIRERNTRLLGKAFDDKDNY